MTFLKEYAHKPLPMLGFGLGVGYIDSLLSICLWPLLAPNGWDKFINMKWDLSQLPLSGIIIAGWLNGLIMAGVLWLVEWGNTKQRIITFVIVLTIAFIRFIIDPNLLLRDFLPPG